MSASWGSDCHYITVGLAKKKNTACKILCESGYYEENLNPKQHEGAGNVWQLAWVDPLEYTACEVFTLVTINQLPATFILFDV